MNPEESALARAEAGLYGQVGASEPAPQSRLQERPPAIPHAWEAPAPLPVVERRRPLSFAVKFLIGAVVFFVIAGIAAAFFLITGGLSVSTNNISIAVDGPTTAAGGDTITLLITVENHNPVSISNTTLDAVFPDGTRSADEVTQPFSRYDDTIGDLGAGQAITRTVQAVVFGSEGSQITIPVKVQYKTANSNAVFVKEYDYTLSITTSPVSVTATSVSQISSGQPLTISVDVRNNAAKPLSNLALLATYPFGFSIASTSLSSTNGLFSIGTLDPGEEKKITITGTLSGADTDARVFHFNAGSTASSTNGSLGVTYATADSSITIEQPFLGIALSLNGSTSGTPTVSPGDVVQGTLTWTNNLDSPVLNGVLTISLSGGAYDPRSVVAQNGFYQSSNNTIRFDSSTTSGLDDLEPGDTGVGTFSFKIKSANDLASLRSPSATLTVSASGRRTSESGVASTLNSTLTRTMKVESGLSLSSGIVHTVGPFENSGPWPPVAGVPTTYTVMLTATNGANSTAGSSVTMTLPSYVSFTNVVTPSGAVTYSDSTRTVRWTVGDLAPNASAQGAFQISFLPSVSQSGTHPMLVSSQSLSGTDRFTQTTVTAHAPALTTDASSDPSYSSADGLVQ